MLIPIISIPFFFVMPGVVFAGLWFLMLVLQATTDLFIPTAVASIAWWGHIGGFIAGFPSRHRCDTSDAPWRHATPTKGFLGSTSWDVDTPEVPEHVRA